MTDVLGNVMRWRTLRRPVELVWREFSVFLVIACSLGGVWLFMALADEVMEEEPHALDEAILLAMRVAGNPAEPWGPAWLEEAARDVTALGSTAILTMVTVGALVFLIMVAKRSAAVLLFASVVGGLALTNLLKIGFDRPRPDLVPQLMDTFTASFPSGHAAGAAVTYLTLGALLTRVQGRQRIKLFLMGVAILITVLVGISRVYLGVHWPSDVVGGWALGAAWAGLVWLVALWLQSRGRVEGETDADSERTLPPGRPLSGK